MVVRRDVCVVIPTYNEVGSIGELVVSLLGLDGLSVRVVVVDDGSNDGTLEVLGELMESMVASSWSSGGRSWVWVRRFLRGSGLLWVWFPGLSSSCPCARDILSLTVGRGFGVEEIPICFSRARKFIFWLSLLSFNAISFIVSEAIKLQCLFSNRVFQ